jgi:hypothetical protein
MSLLFIEALDIKNSTPIGVEHTFALFVIINWSPMKTSYAIITLNLNLNHNVHLKRVPIPSYST